MRIALIPFIFIWLTLGASLGLPPAAAAETIAQVGPGAWTVQVEVPEAVAGALRNRQTGVRLNIRGLRVPGGVKPIVNVFADLPPGTTSVRTDDPHYIGYLAIVPPKVTPPGEVAVLSGGTLDATSALNLLPPANRKVAITLAPAEGGRADAGVSAGAVYFTVD